MKELLIPVGSMDALKYAVLNGADAVYLGGKKFGARAYAQNFDEETLKEAVLFAHLYGVKVYVTVNTLIFERELSNVLDYLIFLESIHVDAVIVSDLGLISWLQQNLPHLNVHVSTQAHTFNADIIRFYKSLGVTRVVVDREMSLEEIKALPDILEIECFIHGALCVCYSGQCLFSYFKDGRSGNRGTCSQSCRMPYSLFENGKKLETAGKYLLSTKELNTSLHIDELLKSNITSFKVEGRMKSPLYVGFITRFYRRLFDGEKVNAEDRKKLKVMFNREFTDGYLFNAQNIMNFKTPNHQGINLGKVIAVNKDKIKILLEEDLAQEDGIRFKNKDMGFIVNFLYDEKGKLINQALKGSIVYVDNKVNLKDKDIVLKTLDKKLMNEIANYEPRKVDIDLTVKVTDDIFSLTLKDSHHEINVSSKIVSKALKRSITKEEIQKQMNRLKDTPFKIRKITIEIPDDIFIPVSKMNEIRREAVSKLIEKRQNYV